MTEQEAHKTLQQINNHENELRELKRDIALPPPQASRPANPAEVDGCGD
jgi:hypothetical protein